MICAVYMNIAMKHWLELGENYSTSISKTDKRWIGKTLPMRQWDKRAVRDFDQQYLYNGA